MLLLTTLIAAALFPNIHAVPASTTIDASASAPTVGPTKKVGKLPALGYAIYKYEAFQTSCP